MRSRLIFALALILTLFAASALPASAIIEPGPDVSRNKFVNDIICVGSTLDPAYYPVAAIAQMYNETVNPSYIPPGDSPYISLDFSTNCAADGYIAAHRMVIGTFSNPDYNGCLYAVNQQTVPEDGDSYMNVWTNGPGVYINRGIPGCVSTAQRRSHQVSAAIGNALGLNVLYSSGWASRVMCTCSLDTIRYPSSYDSNKLAQVYGGSFGPR